MKKLKHFDYLLISNVIITGILQFNYFSIIGMISVVLSLVYLVFILAKGDDNIVTTIWFLVAAALGFTYYVLNPLFEKNNFNYESIAPLAMLALVIIFIFLLSKTDNTTILGFHSKKALKDQNRWNTINNFALIVSFFFILPLFALVFYLDKTGKLAFSFLVLGLIIFLVGGSVLFVGEKKKNLRY